MVNVKHEQSPAPELTRLLRLYKSGFPYPRLQGLKIIEIQLFKKRLTIMDLALNATFATNSQPSLWKGEFRSFRAIDYIYLFSATSFAVAGFLVFARRFFSPYLRSGPDFDCPVYHVQNGDMGPPLIEGFAKVRNYETESMQSFPQIQHGTNGKPSVFTLTFRVWAVSKRAVQN